MSEVEQPGDGGPAGGGNGTAPNQVRVQIERIYLKDASFESPSSPDVFRTQIKPKFQVDINTRTSSITDSHWEVVLKATVTARTEDDTVCFICEIDQAGIFRIEGGEAQTLGPLLSIHCPQTLFPYAREALDALVVKGGFPPVQLAPVNFEAVYAQALQQQQAQQNAETH